MIHYVYEITNTINHKTYIGIHSTTNIEDGYMGSGVALKAALEKHGLENFTKEILHIVDTREEASEIEASLVTEEFCKLKSNYNLRTGGDTCYAQHSETRKKMSENRPKTHNISKELRKKYSQSMIENNPMQKEELREKVRQSKLGKPRDNETKSKISQTLKGKQPAFLNPRVQSNPELVKRWMLLDQIYDLKQQGYRNIDIYRKFSDVFPGETSIRAMINYINENGDPRQDPRWIGFMSDTSQ